MDLDIIKGFGSDCLAFARQHKPEILIGVGTAGLVLTTALGIKAGRKIQSYLDTCEERGIDPGDEIRSGNALGVVKAYAPMVLPPVAAAIGTGAAYISAFKMRSDQLNTMTATAISAVALASKYQDLFVSAKKERSNRKNVNIAQLEEEEHDDARAAVKVVGVENIGGKGDAIFYDEVTGHLFRTSKSRLEEARAEIAKMTSDGVSGDPSISDFYALLGHDCNWELGDCFGWTVDCPLDFSYNARYDDELEQPIAVLKYRFTLLPKIQYAVEHDYYV